MHIHNHSFSVHIPHLSRARFLHTTGWSVLLAALIVGLAATLARATLSLSGAVTDGTKSDIAIYLLLGDEKIHQATLLRSNDFGEEPQRDYLVETDRGPELVQLRKRHAWYVVSREALRSE